MPYAEQTSSLGLRRDNTVRCDGRDHASIQLPSLVQPLIQITSLLASGSRTAISCATPITINARIDGNTSPPSTAFHHPRFTPTLQKLCALRRAVYKNVLRPCVLSTSAHKPAIKPPRRIRFVLSTWPGHVLPQIVAIPPVVMAAVRSTRLAMGCKVETGLFQSFWNLRRIVSGRYISI